MKQAAVCIIHDNTSPRYIHMLRRTETDPSAPGKLCFPGGKLDEGETPKEACLREVYEETKFRLDPESMELVSTVLIGDCQTYVYRCWSYKPSPESWLPVLSDEHDSYRMVSYEHATSPTPFGPYTADILASYREAMLDEDYAKAIIPGVIDIVALAPVATPPTPRNTFEVTTKFYSGDADAYHTTTKLVSQERKAELVDHLDRMCRIRDMEISDSCVDHWPQWALDVWGGGIIEWPADCYSDGDRAATLDSIEVFYYDHNGVKCNCKVVTR